MLRWALNRRCLSLRCAAAKASLQQRAFAPSRSSCAQNGSPEEHLGVAQDPALPTPMCARKLEMRVRTREAPERPLGPCSAVSRPWLGNRAGVDSAPGLGRSGARAAPRRPRRWDAAPAPLRHRSAAPAPLGRLSGAVPTPHGRRRQGATARAPLGCRCSGAELGARRFHRRVAGDVGDDSKDRGPRAMLTLEAS